MRCSTQFDLNFYSISAALPSYIFSRGQTTTVFFWGVFFFFPGGNLWVAQCMIRSNFSRFCGTVQYSGTVLEYRCGICFVLHLRRPWNNTVVELASYRGCDLLLICRIMSQGIDSPVCRIARKNKETRKEHKSGPNQVRVEVLFVALFSAGGLTKLR